MRELHDIQLVIEITSAVHNAEFDRWHERLTNGALGT
jgi:hypothetical protein